MIIRVFALIMKRRIRKFIIGLYDGEAMSHVWKYFATRDHLHLVDILEKTLFFVFNARAIAEQIVEVVINLTSIGNTEFAPKVVDQGVLEKGDTLITAIV